MDCRIATLSFEGPIFSHVVSCRLCRTTYATFCHDVAPSEGTTFGCCVENVRHFSKRPTFFITTRHFYIDMSRKSAICRDMLWIFATFFILILYIFANFPRPGTDPYYCLISEKSMPLQYLSTVRYSTVPKPESKV